MNTEALIEALNAIYRAVTDRPLEEKDKHLFTQMKIANEFIANELQFKRKVDVQTDWVPVPWPGIDEKRTWEAMIHFVSPR